MLGGAVDETSGKTTTTADASADAATATKKVKKLKKPHAAGKPLGKGELTVRVLQARGLKAADDDGTSDPFVEVSIRDAANKELLEEKTKTKKNTLTPEWNQIFTFPIDPAAGHTTLRLMVRDKDRLKSQFLGDLRLPLDTTLPLGVRQWHELVARPEFPDKLGQVGCCFCVVL